VIAVNAVIVTAMPDESGPFIARADFVGNISQVGQAVHRVLSIEDRGVLLVQCGVGLVNSATAAAVAINGTSPAALISAGSAGGIGADVRVGDVVVGSRYLYSGADARVFGYELGQVPGMPAFYPADAALLAAANRIDPSGLRVLPGAMLSGDTFIDDSTVRALRESFPEAMSTDMESTALAHTCHLYGVPFLSVRGISDLCGPQAGTDFAAHVDDAAERSVAVVIGILHEMSTKR